MKQVLVIREFDNFSRILTENQFEVINLPTIKTSQLKDLSDFQAKLKNINSYDGIFLTSKESAKTLNEQNINFKGKIYILGKRSFEILKDQNFDLFFDESASTANELLEKIPLENLKNKRFLFIRGEKSLRTIPDFLSKIAEVEETIVYRTEQNPIEIDKIKSVSEKCENGEIAAACFFSPSGAESFLEQFGAEVLQKTKIAVIGKTTADFFVKKDLNVDFIASKSTAKSFAVELLNKLKIDN